MKREEPPCECRWVGGKRIRCAYHEEKVLKSKQPFIRPRLYATSPSLVLAVGQSIKDAPARALFFFLYLTGARINEATDFTPSRLEVFPDRYIIRLKTEKQRTPTFRKTPIPRAPTSRCGEDVMWGDVYKYIQKFGPYSYPFRIWKNMSMYMARNVPEMTFEATIQVGAEAYTDKQVVKRFNPHHFRHTRATHLVEYYGFNTASLCLFFGWSKSEYALYYTRTSDVWKAFHPNP
jgi:integrase